ncbi:hypothetical protein AGMMS49938_03610 [Fibrobacterales bacterium]|nr:hypothetical protein AGMMS49938_03610 [Fibrobacterales bacterium]
MIMDAEQLYLRYAPMVLRRCNNLLRNKADAADIAQSVFIKVWEKQGELNGEYPSSLLWRMATNACLNHIRDTKRHADPNDDILLRIASAEDVEANFERRDILAKLFSKHPVSSRTIAVLHLIDGMTLEEVAAEVKMSVGGVRKRLRSLKSSLHELEAL